MARNEIQQRLDKMAIDIGDIAARIVPVDIHFIILTLKGDIKSNRLHFGVSTTNDDPLSVGETLEAIGQIMSNPEIKVEKEERIIEEPQ